jgi:hypothetical protein
MAALCWRLLAVFLQIFVASIFVAPTLLRGQADAGNRLPLLSRVSAGSSTAWRYSPPTAPVWIPPPGLTRPYPAAPGTIGSKHRFFSQLVRSSGIIFSGRVTSIGLAPSSLGHAEASTNVTFQVEQAMRGASAGKSLTIHEWAGLWMSGERYHVGERVLLFLYSPSKLGLTSPVAGALGRFAMDSEGRIVLSAQHVAALADDPVFSSKAANKTANKTGGKTGGKSVVPYADFIQAVRRSGGEE